MVRPIATRILKNPRFDSPQESARADLSIIGYGRRNTIRSKRRLYIRLTVRFPHPEARDRVSCLCWILSLCVRCSTRCKFTTEMDDILLNAVHYRSIHPHSYISIRELAGYQIRAETLFF